LGVDSRTLQNRLSDSVCLATFQRGDLLLEGRDTSGCFLVFSPQLGLIFFELGISLFQRCLQRLELRSLMLVQCLHIPTSSNPLLHGRCRCHLLHPCRIERQLLYHDGQCS
jgi:hypothetical protein